MNRRSFIGSVAAAMLFPFWPKKKKRPEWLHWVVSVEPHYKPANSNKRPLRVCGYRDGQKRFDRILHRPPDAVILDEGIYLGIEDEPGSQLFEIYVQKT